MVSIIPCPQSVTLDGSGKTFVLDPGKPISFSGPAGGDVAELLAGYLGTHVNSAAKDAAITLKTGSAAVLDTAGFADESHTLEVGSAGVVIEALNDHGLARGIQTPRQLLPPEALAPGAAAGGEWRIPCLRISDRPRFRWCGLHVDISRHFMDAEQLCDFIDVMALHKLNVLHLHLTDDQGWRMGV